MGKTNHRINKDREEKRGEALAHRRRRESNTRLDQFVEIYNHDDDELDAEELFEFEEVRFEKIRRHD